MVRKEFLELLRTDSAFREEVRRQILTDDLLTLPQKFDSLTELVAESLTILKELVGVVRTLVEAQQRSEAILQRHEEQIGLLIEAQRGTEAQLRELVTAQQRTEAILQRHEERFGEIIATQQQIFEILRRHEEQIGLLIEAQRQTEVQLRELATAQQRTEAILQRHEERFEEIIATQQQIFEILQRHEEQIGLLIEAQRKTEARLGELVEAQRRTEVILQRHEEQIGLLIEAQRQMGEQLQELAKAQQRTEEQLQKLVQWQQGEIGRQRGRDYEREIIRRAPFLFQGGEGGSAEEFVVRQRLTEQLASILSEVPDDKDADPFLADLLWWKGDCVAVVEVSLQVNGYDVHRAAQRAATLRRAGLHALPMVIGESWTGSDAQDVALSKKVEWKVGPDLSEGFIDFRRRSPRG